MAPRALTAAVALSLATQAEGQFLRSVIVKQGPSESLVSSFSWFRDEDGEMHQKSKEEHTKIITDEFGTQRSNVRTSCTDGNCDQSQSLTMSVPMDAPCPMKAMMIRMARVMGFGAPPPMTQMSGAFAERPPMPMPPNMMPPPPMMMGPPPIAPHMVIVSSPNLRGMLQRLRVGTSGMNDNQDVAVVRSPVHHTAKDTFQNQVVGPLIGISAIVVGLGLGIIVSSKLCASASAREPTLSNLAEPFAPVEDAVALPPKAPVLAKVAVESPRAGATAAARSFLPGIYAKAQASLQSKAVRGYLATVYERTAASA